METTAQSVTPRTAVLLKKFGCASASLGLETGNLDLRKGVLDKNTENGAYVRAFRLLRENGIRGVSFNMIGLPFETREDIFDTIRLNKGLGTDAQSVGIFYPYKGTPIRTFCERRGLLDEDFERKLLSSPTMNFVTYTRGVGSALKLSGLSGEELVRLRKNFAYYVVAPEWLWPLIDECGGESKLSEELGRTLFDCLYLKKYGCESFDTGRGKKSGDPRSLQGAAADCAHQGLPPWLQPFLGKCEEDEKFRVTFGERLLELWRHSEQESAEQVVRTRAVATDGPSACEEEEFNKGGLLPRARLNAIRKEMRKLAKEDALILISEIGRRGG
jgi:hypothetical protein